MKMYIKNSYLKIIYFSSIFLVVNLILVSSTPIHSSFSDIFYMDVLLVLITLFFWILDYRMWKANYSELIKEVQNRGHVDTALPDINSSFEIQLIKEIVNLKNSEMEHNVEKIKENLDEVNDYITKWVHEIKIPIAVCELIADKLDEEENIISEEIRIEIERIKFLINQVLYTSRASTYSEDLHISEISIDKVIRDVIKKNSVFFIAKNIELKLEMANYTVLTDEKWIAYILDQIINNACKYVEREGKLHIYTDEDEKMIRVFIRDNGSGISETDIRRIFDKGFTGKNGRKVSKSTGIGLYLSKKMAHKLHHSLYVTSKEGSYTEFTLCFYKLSDYFKVT